MPLFLRITLAVAIALVALVVLGFLLKIFVLAALIAALVVGVLIVTAAVRRRLEGRSAYPSRRF
jgi:hypothetical protein